MRIASMLALSVLCTGASLGAQEARMMAGRTGAEEISAPKHLDLGIDLRQGTLGIGGEISKLIVARLGIRAGFNYFSLNHSTTQSDIAYDAKIKLQSMTFLADFFPIARGAFHLTGGILANSSSADGIASCADGTIDINSHSYTCAQIGTMSGAVKFPSASPYVGLGFGTPAGGSRVHFLFDIGAAFGTPTVSLSASNSSSNAQLASDVKAQRDQTQKDVEKYVKVYPVIQSGLGVRF
jgi:hypothetical protein